MGALVSRSDKRVPALAILFGQSKETWAVEPHPRLHRLPDWNACLALSFAQGLIGYLIGMPQ
jgi:hypothetical protein